MSEIDIDRYKIEQMRQFYEFFPYPNRPIVISPSLQGQMPAHGAFATLIKQGYCEEARKMNECAFGLKTAKTVFNRQDLGSLESIFPATRKILLVGCGTDEPLLFRLLHPKNEIVCIDLSKKNIRKARRKLFFQSFLSVFKIKLTKNIAKTEFILADAGMILNQKHIGLFDYIQCFGVLHHQPNPEILFHGMANRLTSEGFLRLMVYSYHGRKLERKIQKRYIKLWEQLSLLKKYKIALKYNFFLLSLWQILNFFGLFKSTALRFKYLGIYSNAVADAFMHPSDPGLELEKIIPMAHKNGLKIIYCQAKIQNEGTIYGYENPLYTWEKIVIADKKEKLLSNPILIFQRVKCGK